MLNFIQYFIAGLTFGAIALIFSTSFLGGF